MQVFQYFDKKRKAKLWRFDVTLAGKRFRHGGFARKKDAEDALAGLHLIVQRMRYQLPMEETLITLGDLQDKLAADKSTPKRLEWIFGQFVALLGQNRAIQSLKRSDMKTFADHLQEARTLNDSSFRLYMQRVSAALNRAGDYFDHLETWKAPRLPKLPAGIKRTRTVKKPEIAAFLRVLAEPWPHDRPGTHRMRLDLCDIIRLMLLFAARREEIEKIVVKKLDREERTLWLYSGKTGKDHLIPLSEPALAILLRRQPAASGKLFTPLETAWITRTMARAAEFAQSPFGRNEAWTVHDLRRTASVNLERAGIAFSAIQDLLGHSRQGATANYTPAQWDELQRAVKELATWCRDIDKEFAGYWDPQGAPLPSSQTEAA